MYEIKFYPSKLLLSYFICDIYYFTSLLQNTFPVVITRTGATTPWFISTRLREKRSARNRLLSGGLDGRRSIRTMGLELSQTFPRLELSRTFSGLELSRTFPGLELSRTRAFLDFSRTFPRLELSRTFPRLFPD